MVIDFSDLLGEDGITIKAHISLDTADVMASLGDKEQAREGIKNIIEKNVDGIVDDMESIINDIADKVIDFAANTAAKIVVDGLVEEILKDAGSDKTVEQVFEEADIDDKDAYIEEKTSKVIEAIKSGDNNSKEIAAEITTIVEEVYNDFKDVDEFNGKELTDEDKAEIEADLEEMLKSFEDEDGNINIDAFMDELLGSVMGSGNSNSDNNDENEGESKSVATGVTASSFAASYSKAPTIDEDASEEEVESTLKAILRDTIMEAFDDDTLDGLISGLQIISYVLIFTFATWAYPILKILVKLAAKNPGIKLKVPIWLGCIPFMVLMGLPTIAVKSLPTLMSSMAGGEAAEAVSTMLEGLSITFFSSSVVSFGVAVFFVLFGLFFYGRVRRKLKKELKAAKRARKLAAKAGAYEVSEVETDEE